MMFGKQKQNGVWLASSRRWRLMFADGVYLAAGRVRVRLFAAA